jgi:tryptophan synthase alpha chain
MKTMEPSTGNRIDALFRTKQERVLSIYMTAGYPRLEDTVKVIRSLEKAGADLVEVGMPFSDPLADGPVIQYSSQVALKNGMTIEGLFRQLDGIRDRVSIPLVLMGYLNPVLQFGMDRFLDACISSGIDGVILPDLPLDEFRKNYRQKFLSAGVSFIMLITPQTSPERVAEIADVSSGFLYMVADSSTTGAKDGIRSGQLDYFRRIKEMKLELPRMIGFGISNAETFNTACRYGNGAIIGSAFIEWLGKPGSDGLEKRISSFVKDRILEISP